MEKHKSSNSGETWGHETIFLGKKDNNDVALLLDSNISFHIEDGDYISSPPVDVAKTYIDLIVEVRGKLGQDFKIYGI